MDLFDELQNFSLGNARQKEAKKGVGRNKIGECKQIK
jgi:hypothetical protein